jgi:hypothetical protein
MGESNRLRIFDQPQRFRRRSGDHVVAVLEEDNALHIYPLKLVPIRPYVDPLVRLEEARCEVFSALAPIVGADGLVGLFADFDAALADLKRERDQ